MEAHSGSAGPVLPGAEEYVRWAAPDCPAIDIRRNVLEGVQGEVVSALNAVPRRGAETGGLLLGRWSGNELSIESFEPVPCEHRFGPSYQLSKADMQVLDETCLRFRAGPRDGLAIVGFYRSVTRPVFGLAAEDQRLFSTYFPDPRHVLLLIKPSRLQPGVADFFFWRNGQLVGGGQPRLFPFRRQTDVEPPKPALPEEPERIERHEPPRVVTEQKPDVAPRALPGRQPARDSRPRYWLLPVLALAFTAIGCVLGYFYSRYSRPRPHEAERVRVVQAPQPVQPPPVRQLPGEPNPAPRLQERQRAPAPAPPAEHVEHSLSTHDQVAALIYRWADAVRRGDVENAARLYVSPSEGLRDLHGILARHGRLAVNRVSNIEVVPEGGNLATAKFRRHWETAGGPKYAVEQEERLRLLRGGNGWRIISAHQGRTFWIYRGR